MKNGKRCFLSLVMLTVVLTFFLIPCVAKSQTTSQVINFRLQMPTGMTALSTVMTQKMAANLDKMSGGRLKMQVVPDGTVVQAFELLDAVSKGVLEAANSVTGFWAGKHPAALLFSSPIGGGVGLDQLSHIAWLFEGGGNELYDEFYRDILKANVVAFQYQAIGPDSLGWFRKPIESTADFRKVKYRSPPGIIAEIFKEMGIPVVSMPPSEILTAGERGVIDAAEMVGPAEDMMMGFHTVWKHVYPQGLCQATDLTEMLINKDFWNKLSPDLQEIIRVGAMASITDNWNATIYRNAEALKILKEKHGVQVHETPRDYYPEFVKTTYKVLNKYADKDPFFKKVLESQRKFAQTVVPYWTKELELYHYLGIEGLKAMGMEK
jgi:TRAP-type mannitol/chloroaromatic compound transport system substrate-binding protein